MLTEQEKECGYIGDILPGGTQVINEKTQQINTYTLYSRTTQCANTPQSKKTVDYVLNGDKVLSIQKILNTQNFDSLYTEILSALAFTKTTPIPTSIRTFFDSISTTFSLSVTPTEEQEFYSPNGNIAKQSWKIDLLGTNLGKKISTFLNQTLSSNPSKSAGIGGGGINAYENSEIECYHIFMSQPANGAQQTNYLSCALK